MFCLKYLQFSIQSAYCSGKYCGLMCHPYNVLRKGKILVSSFVGMRRGEERKAASHWPEENAWVKRYNRIWDALKGVTPDFDLSLSYQISWTDDASFNRIFLTKHLTQKVFSDSLSAVTEPPGGSKELLKFETSKGINFGYSYPIFMKFLPFDFIFKCLPKLVVSLTNSHPFTQN